MVMFHGKRWVYQRESYEELEHYVAMEEYSMLFYRYPTTPLDWLGLSYIWIITMVFGIYITNGLYSDIMNIIRTVWVNYHDLTVLPNPGIIVSRGNDPQMALIQVSEIL